MIEDMRSFIKILEDNRELIRIRREVNTKFELAAVLRKLELETGQAAFFENVKGFKIPVVGGLYGTLRRIGLGLGLVSEARLYKFISEASKRTSHPRLVKDASVKEVVTREANLFEYPIPTSFEKDVGPYITADVTVSKDPVAGRYNTGIYRMQVIDKNKLLIYSPSGGNLGNFHLEAEKLGVPLDIAISIGVDPATIIAASLGRFFPEVDELWLAGGLRGIPTDVIQCETVDLYAPATAEIIIEGKILPSIREFEGPFAEYTDYYGYGDQGRLVKVTAIMHKRNPIYQTILGGSSREHLTLGATVPYMLSKKQMLKALKEKFPNVIDLNVPVGEGVPFLIFVSMRKKSNEEPAKLLKTILELPWRKNFPLGALYKLVVIVDDDVNIYNVKDVMWAICTRIRDAEDAIVVPSFPTIGADPAERSDGTSVRLGIDATKPLLEAKKYERTKIPGLGEVSLEKYIEK